MVRPNTGPAGKSGSHEFVVATEAGKNCSVNSQRAGCQRDQGVDKRGINEITLPGEPRRTNKQKQTKKMLIFFKDNLMFSSGFETFDTCRLGICLLPLWHPWEI